MKNIILDGLFFSSPFFFIVVLGLHAATMAIDNMSSFCLAPKQIKLNRSKPNQQKTNKRQCANTHSQTTKVNGKMAIWLRAWERQEFCSQHAMYLYFGSIVVAHRDVQYTHTHTHTHYHTLWFCLSCQCCLFRFPLRFRFLAFFISFCPSWTSISFWPHWHSQNTKHRMLKYRAFRVCACVCEFVFGNDFFRYRFFVVEHKNTRHTDACAARHRGW